MLRAALQKWRENFYVSKLLIALSRPVFNSAAFLATQIPRKIKNNGAAISLPNGRTLRFTKNSGIGIASLVYWQGLNGYEPATSRSLRFFFDRVETFVDVGANCGLYSLLAALSNPKIQVFAFEPEPRIFDFLRTNILVNDVALQVSAYQIALSDRTGKADFYLPPALSQDVESTGTIVAGSWQSQKTHTLSQVEAVRFDEFEATRNNRIELVKIDVEDAEAQVLSGMSSTIARDKPIIICEILPRPHQNRATLKMIQDLGYTPYWITSEGYIQVSDFEFKRQSSQDFLLSPRLIGPGIVTDPAAFLE